MGTGEAYGFLHYKGGPDDISKQLGGFKEDEAKALPELRFAVGKTGELNATGDSALEEILQLAKQADLNYAIKATLPCAGNKAAAEQMVGGMMWINGTLYEDGGPFSAEVVYKEGENYVRMQ